MNEFYTPIPVEPKIINMFFNNVKKDCFSVVVAGKEYIKCEESAEKWWCKKKPGFYGQGMANTAGDKNKTIRTGIVGEMGYGKIFNLPVDLAYREKGKDDDFIMGPNKTIDVKTATYNYSSGLVYAKNEYFKNIPLKVDIYVFGFLQNEDRIKKSAEVVLVGYAMREFISKIPIIMSEKTGATHMNYKVPYKDLKPINLLLMAHKNYLKK